MVRKKKIILNFFSDFVPQILIAFIGIIKIKLFLNHWSTDVVGLYQLYNQLFSYISLVEVGISSVILYRLYAPFLKKDKKNISKIYNGANFSFRIISSIIIILGLLLSFFISFFIKDNTFTNSFLQITFILYVISNVFNYYTMAKRLIFYADEKNYVVNIVQQGLTVVKGILEITLVLMGFKIISVIVLAIVINLIINITIHFLYRKNYKGVIISKEKSFAFLPDLKSMSIHKFSNLISNNIDVVLISKFIGLESVTIYTVYQYITLSLQTFTDKISNSILSSLGIVLKENKKRGIEIFKKINNIVYFVAIAICIPLFFSINYFIRIWYTDTVYTSTILSLLFSTLLFLNISKQIFNLFVNALGFFDKIVRCSIIDMIMNFSLSLILVIYMKIPGVLLATIVSMLLTEFVMKSSIILKELGSNLFEYFKESYIFIVFLLGNSIVIYAFSKYFEVSNLIIWIIYGIVIFIVNIVLLIIEFKLSKKFESLEYFLPDKIKRIINKKHLKKV